MSEYSNTWGILTGIRPAKLAMQQLQAGKNDKEILRQFLQEYKTGEGKARLALEVAHNEEKIVSQMYEDGVSLYIGIPFCPTRCVYCSFVTNSVASSAHLIPEYLDCLLREITAVAELVKQKEKRLETVYIGGGTPTTLTAEQLKRLIQFVFSAFDMSGVKEFTVEAGRPDTITEEKLKTLKMCGVNRISINPQSMNEETMRVIGRRHTPDDIRRAFAMARDCGFDIINMDIIAGLPGETFEMFCHTVAEVEKLSPENTTVHTMSIKRASRLKETLEEYSLTRGDEVAQMVDYAREAMTAAGKQPYYLYRQKNILGNLENVGYSKPGFESLYNVYIMEEIQTILALGCGGSTKTVDRKSGLIQRIFNVKEPKDYIQRLDEMLERKRALYDMI